MIPYWRVPVGLLDKAITHALAQTADVTVLVAGDGEVPPTTVRHDRLVVGTFPTNLGAPATQQAMLWGSPFPWYAPHGADDWVDRDHVARLLAARADVVIPAAVWSHQLDGRTVIRRRSGVVEVGLFRTAVLRAVGGYGAQERCGQDSLFVSILLRTERCAFAAKPTYHKVARLGSLTTDPATKGGSPYRTEMRLRNQAVLAECARLGWQRDAIRAYRESLVPPELRTQLEDRAALVARWLT